MKKETPVCGIVMPISEIDGLPEAHWKEIRTIISNSIENAGFTPNLVSNSEDIGVIQKRIVQNLYENPIVVCDVSGKNPNVMFELGMRLAFDKPTIIIKDSKTSYSFDTSPIEHLEYPRDLRFSKIVEFKEKLSEKIKKTHEKASKDTDYSTFLKHFGSFKVAKIDTEEVTKEDLIMDELRSLREMMVRTQRTSIRREQSSLFDTEDYDSNHITICFGDKTSKITDPIISEVNGMSGVKEIVFEQISDDHSHVDITLDGEIPKRILKRRLQKLVGENAEYIE